MVIANFNPLLLLLLLTGYLSLLFFIAHLADRGWISSKLVHSPWTYSLSLGVYCSGWAFFGSIGFAFDFGYNFITYYLGISIGMLLMPILLTPVLRLVRQYQLSSLADLLAFRYRSQLVGLAVTLAMLLATLPLMVLQIQAVAQSAKLISPRLDSSSAAFTFCLLVAIFSMLFGARRTHPNEQNHSLRIALASESVLKLVLFLTLGIYAIARIFGGFDGLSFWLEQNPGFEQSLFEPVQPITWMAMLAMFSFSALLMPNLFLTLFKGEHGEAHLKHAGRWFPVYLLLISLPVLPIMWAGIKLVHPSYPEQFPIGLGIAMRHPEIIWVAFLGGMSAVSGALITLTLALTSMTLHHLVLPYYRPRNRVDIHSWLIWLRRWIILAILAAAFGLYYLLQEQHQLTRLGLISFVGLLHFLPGIFGLLFWARATRRGFLIGLGVGISIWVVLLLIPLITDAWLLSRNLPLLDGQGHQGRFLLASISLIANGLTFFVLSLWRQPTEKEQLAAEICVFNSATRPRRRSLTVESVDDIISALAKPLGQITAEREVQRALQDQGLTLGEYRPAMLVRLREQLEANLSGLVGPSMAHQLIESQLPWLQNQLSAQTDVSQFEQQLEGLHSQLTGLAGELDQMRRYHRQTLMDLPLGVCSLTLDGEIVLWNQAMGMITGMTSDAVIGSNLNSLPSPWDSLMLEFSQQNKDHLYRVPMKEGRLTRWLNLHKAKLERLPVGTGRGQILMIEDQTETRLLESQLLHSERLASIGSLAAGVAHEIGNPVTNIDCLAQDLQFSSDDPLAKEYGQKIREQTQRISRIVQSLMNYAHVGNRDDQSHHQHYRLWSLIDEAIHFVTLGRKRDDLLIRNRVEPDLWISCDSQRLGQVFINLLNNARDASPNGGEISIYSQANEHSVMLYVEDQGSGIEPELLKQIFDPFFTTKVAGKGTGLGLFLSQQIVEEHFGQISAQSPANAITGKGTRFCVNLPLSTTRDD